MNFDEDLTHMTKSYQFSEPPSKPGKPEPVEVTDDSITLFWKPPEDIGNSEIIEYILEYKETKEKT